MSSTRDIKPLFLLHKDIKQLVPSKFQPIKLCRAIHEVIGEDLYGAQQYFGLWRIYVKTLSSRDKLLNTGCTIKDKLLTVFESNPFEDRNVNNEKILIRDLPFCVPDNQLLEYFSKQDQIKLKSNVLYGKILNENYSKSKFDNGDRFVYAESSIYPPLPSKTSIAGYPCRIFHKSQEYKCPRCQKSNHKPNDSDRCEAYTSRQNMPFQKDTDVLSNFYPCSISYNNINFKSAEHSYQYEKLISLHYTDAAQEVIDAATARAAKVIADRVTRPTDLELWKPHSLGAMEKVIHHKAKCHGPFREALIKSGHDILVESTSNTFWGAGLSSGQILNTKPSFFPGENMLGKLLMKLRSELLNLQLSSSSPQCLKSKIPETTPQSTPDRNLQTEPITKIRNTSFTNTTFSHLSSRLSSSAPSSPTHLKLSSKPVLKHTKSTTKTNSSILEYFNSSSNGEALKRRTSSNQENGPTPPGTPGASTSKVMQCDVFNFADTEQNTK